MDETTPARRGPGRPSNAERAAMNRASDAINHPVNTGNNVSLESTDFVPQFDNVVSYKQLRMTVAPPAIETVAVGDFATVAEHEAFMAQELVIQVHESTDRSASPVVPVGLNGEQVYLTRGTKISIPRSLVGSLAQAQELTLRTADERDPNADQGTKITERRMPCYPFNVLYDPSPKLGARWLHKVMREG